MVREPSSLTIKISKDPDSVQRPRNISYDTEEGRPATLGNYPVTRKKLMSQRKCLWSEENLVSPEEGAL